MNAEHYRRLRDAFMRIIDLPRSARAEAAAATFPDEADLREDLLKLLRDADDESAFFESAALAEAVRLRLVEAVETPAEDEDDALIGCTLGGHTIRRRIGRGAAATVFLAEAAAGREPVAIKVLDTGLASIAARRRFEREAEILARLRHPGIAKFHSAGVAAIDGRERPYLVMEFVDGPSLLAFARQRSLDVKARIELLAYVCLAVHSAHEARIVHRDLKPSNIVVNPGGQPKVLDFGVARILEAADERVERDRTQHGFMLGTVAYMSPEQARGGHDEIDASSDVYALGVVGFELLTGRLPYNLVGRPLHEQLRIVSESPPAAASSIDSRLSGAVETVFACALAKAPGDRYAGAKALADDLRRASRGEPVDAAPGGTSSRRRPARHAVFAAIIVLLVLIPFVVLVARLISANQSAAALQQEIASINMELNGAVETIGRLRDEIERLGALLTWSAERSAAGGSNETAALLHRQALDAFGRGFGRNDDRTLIAADRYAESLLALGRAHEAADVLRDSLLRRGETYGEKNHRSINTRLALARALIAAHEAEGDDATLISEAREHIELIVNLLGEGHESSRQARSLLDSLPDQQP